MDLSIITDGWPYDEENDAENVRKVVGVDGKTKIQVRIPNGVVQWESEGRPDGRRPFGHATVLACCERRLSDGEDIDDALSPELVDELVLELFDYYRRSQALFHLGDYDHTLSDIVHALRILKLLRLYAPHESLQFDQYRPGLLVDRARAQMLMEVRQGQLREAFDALNQGINDIEGFYLEHEMDDQIADSPERQILVELRRSLRERHNVPLNDQEILRSLRVEQEVAIRKENYEMAARLRDKIESLKQRIGSQD